nr:TetA [synthetic construct]
MKPNIPLIVILSTVALDAVGIGLIMPVLPGLLRDLVHSNDVTAHYGILLALYALVQFACAPVLGALSDRFGRRPILLVSLAGARSGEPCGWHAHTNGRTDKPFHALLNIRLF